MLPESEKPLHVLVAEALGWSNLHERTEGHWWGKDPYGGMSLAVPIYERSWCSVGPILERIKVSLDAPNMPEQPWSAYAATCHADGNTPCEAVARLIVTLSKEGKLPK